MFCQKEVWKPYHFLFKIMIKDKHFEKYAKLEGQDHLVKTYGMMWKVL